LLELLANLGRFGKNGSEVGEELLRAKLREVELEGWVEKARKLPKRPPPATPGGLGAS